MNAAGLEKYRSALEILAADVEQSLRRRQHIVMETASDALDQTILAAEREVAAQNMEKDYRHLREIQAALARLMNGRYRSCLRCEESIPALRLEAIPWAAFCLGCQEQVDRLQAGVRMLNTRVA